MAALMGLGPESLKNIFGWSPKVAPENVVLLGVRDIDATEKENIRRAGITQVYTMRDIDERGMRTIMEEALRAAGRGSAGYHISLDMDWIDPEDAPGVGTPVRGGATYREAHLAMEIIADHGQMTSFELVEVNPVIDEHNRTADLAVELICSAFGKKFCKQPPGNLLSRIGLMLHLARTLIGFLCRLMRSLLGLVLGGVRGLFRSALYAFAGIFGGVFGAVTGILHVLLKAGIGTLRPAGGQKNSPNTKCRTQREHAQRFLACNYLHESST